MTTEDTRRRTSESGPTGIQEDPVDAAHEINAELGRRVNLPGPGLTGVLLAGMDQKNVGPLALVSIALSLADIAVSLRKLSSRDD
jgi:hypothetical protein